MNSLSVRRLIMSTRKPVRKLLSAMIVVVFFLISIPCYASQSAARPVTYEQAKMQEIVKELGLDQQDLPNELSDGAKGLSLQAQREEALSEFADVRALLDSIPSDPRNKETIQKAFEMTVNKLDEAKAREYVERLGITEKALSLTASLVDIHEWLKNHPKTCAVIVSIIVCIAVIIILILVGVILAVVGVV
jgi:hypothetical protein